MPSDTNSPDTGFPDETPQKTVSLDAYLAAAAKKIGIEADEYSEAERTPLRKAASHLLVSGGKRLRPALLMLSADAVRQGAAADVFPAAFGIELLHTYTLVHDDIMDNDSMRRGTPTVHTVYGNTAAILAGDLLYGDAFSYICRAEAAPAAKTAAVQMLSHTCHMLCEGQSADAAFETRDDVSLEEYLSMVRGKTGSLLAASAGIGSLLAGGTPQQTAALYTLGMNAGIAFQIRDDVLDLTASPDVLGKNRASDLRENKQTIVSVFAREAGVDLSAYHKPDLTEAEISEVISSLENAGVFAKAAAYSEKLIADAKAGLSVFPDSDEKQMLCAMADLFVVRES